MPELKLPFFAHGGDYNPDQWRDRPDILREDIRLMKLAGCNMMSVGIFAWAALEPEEGHYDFDWLEKILDDLYANGIYVFLATPSGARPAWMSRAYPEVLRVRADGGRNAHGARHNHCFSSPVYREKVTAMNTALASRFGKHPAVKGWHISNEYSGECHCEYCQDAFRAFLRKKYGTLDALNHAWWTGFWSKTYTDWAQLRSPSPYGEDCVHGLTLDWKRFVTEQTVDFIRTETAPIRAITPDLPVTTNLMEEFGGLDYYRIAEAIDFASFDSYPRWKGHDDADLALHAAFNYDTMRSLKHKPFILMESTPSQVNWQEVCKLKKPGMHFLSSLQSVAHGSDSVMYFQWRKSRGATEKFHGAVVDHVGHENTRTFRDVSDVGSALKKLTPIVGTRTQAKIALIYDLNNRWALEDCQGPRKEMHYMQVLFEHYRALKRLGMNVDVIDQSADLSDYALVSAPMLYMVKPGFAEKVEHFVRDGGIFVTGARSGCVDDTDLCFLGGFPGPLRALLGIWVEETDALYDDEFNSVNPKDGGEYPCGDLCDIVHAETASVEAVYGKDFYAGTPAVTCNRVGNGEAWYVASRMNASYLDRLYTSLADTCGLKSPVADVPQGVQVTTRIADDTVYLFVMNFADTEVDITLPAGMDLLSDKRVDGRITLEHNGIRILQLDR